MSRHRIDEVQQRDYHENGFVTLRQVFARDDIRKFERELTDAVDRLHDNSAQKPPNSDGSAYEQAFTQVMNVWCHSTAVRNMVFGERLASMAAEIMGVGGVRLYHDQALYKEPYGGHTPWHCDQYYWPLDTDQTITAWIPLQDTSIEMGALVFSAGSHRIDLGRDLPIGDDSQTIIEQKLSKLELPCIESDFHLGDVSFHSGWTFHRAGANLTGKPRRAMTIIYMADDARLKQPENANQEADRKAWCPGVNVGEVIASELNPRLYPRTGRVSELERHADLDSPPD